jgi:uncharacterized protein (DUF2141 family)
MKNEKIQRKLASRLVAVSLLLSTATVFADSAPAGNVVEFRMSLRKKGGVVRCGIFTKEGWLKKPTASDIARANGKSAICVFKQIPKGTYGISAFHDENSNGELDTNLVGYPLEDYCASNNARNMFSAPSFDDAKFSYKGGQKRLEALMK